MNRCLVAISLSALSVGMLVAGCQKAADQQSSPDANSSPSVAETAKEAVKKAIEPKPLVVPAETEIAVVLDQTVSSKTSRPGDKFTATVESPVEVEGKVAIPKGARAEGVVNDAKAAGRFKGRGSDPKFFHSPAGAVGLMAHILPLPLGEGRGEGLSALCFAPSPNPSQREGKKPSMLFR